MGELNWIKHDGGPMPVPGDTIVKIKLANGDIWPNSERAEAFTATPTHPQQSDWWIDGGAYTEIAQIVEYAIVKPSPSAVSQPAIDAHYTKYAIQPMEFSLANGLDAAQHTVIKYTVRYRDKGGIRDLRAAIRVLELMIEREEKAKANG